jgi:hypothetical protein
MKRFNLTKLAMAAALITLLCLFFTGCGAAPDDTALQAAYLAAIQDARVAEPGEICATLEPITWYNPDLVWEGQPGTGRVLLLTWTSWDGYNDKTGANMTQSRDTWVVVPAELHEFYRKNSSLDSERLVLRLEQLYGLPPHNGKKWFVEMWADPADIFRPSPDPDTADGEAELDFPGWVDAAYKDWFNQLKSTSYGDDGYPWTRLGYTYDWGGGKNEIGLSEFVIRAGSTVGIYRVTGNLDYLKN